MKHFFGPKKPDYFVEGWPGQFKVFSWLEYLFAEPNVISIITTRKENGAPNACLHHKNMMVGGGDNYSSLTALYLHYHTYANILRENEWCINFPNTSFYPQCFQTIALNGPENDEITDVGLTVEPGQTVKAPRIAECLVSIECRLEWDRPVQDGSNMHLFCGRVTGVAFDESLVNCGLEERLRAMDTPILIQGQNNPLTGERLSEPYEGSILKL